MDCSEIEHIGLNCENAKRANRIARRFFQSEADKKEHEELSEMWMRSFCRNCPKCRVPIQKMQGCNHISCKSCRHEFCWKCGVKWSKHKICKAIKNDKKEDDQKTSRLELETIQKIRDIVEMHLPVIRSIESYRRANSISTSVVAAWKRLVLGLVERVVQAILCFQLCPHLQKDDSASTPLFQFTGEEMVQWWTTLQIPQKSSNFSDLQDRLFRMVQTADQHLRALSVNKRVRRVENTFDVQLHRTRSEIHDWVIRIKGFNRKQEMTKRGRQTFYYIAGVVTACFVSTGDDICPVRIKPNEYLGAPLDWKHCFVPFIHAARYLVNTDTDDDQRPERPRVFINKHHKPVHRRKGSYLVFIDREEEQYELIVPHRDFILGLKDGAEWLQMDSVDIRSTLIE
jgi:hypothetical protein